MKELKLTILALVAILFASCMGDSYDEPGNDAYQPGNNALVETNVLTIQQLKDKYATAISGNTMMVIDDAVQIKGIVTGNDIEGNVAGEISLQDETGAILICITAPNMFAVLPVGQEILVDLKGLIIGGYGQQPEIGGVYTSTNPSSSSYGSQAIGRLSRFEWEKHYKLIGKPDAKKVDAMIEDFDMSKRTKSDYLAANCAKVMRLRNVTLADADGTNIFAPKDGSVALTANAVNRTFKGISSSSMVLRTSVYAKFAATIMPQGAHDFVGIFTRYRDTWQILLRSYDDVGAPTTNQ